MSNHTRKCIVCGAEYEYCPSCSKYSKLPRWKFNFDVENCMNLFMIAGSYNSKTITAEEARNQFNACDLSKKDSLSPDVANVINQVFAEAKDEAVETKSESKEEVEKPVERQKKEYDRHYQKRHDNFRR